MKHNFLPGNKVITCDGGKAFTIHNLPTYRAQSAADHQLATFEERDYHISADTSSRVAGHLDQVIQLPYSVQQVVKMMTVLHPSSVIKR